MKGSVTLSKKKFPEIQLKKGIFSSKYFQNFMLRMHQNASQSIYISKNFRGGMPPYPPSRDYAPSALVVHALRAHTRDSLFSDLRYKGAAVYFYPSANTGI